MVDGVEEVVDAATQVAVHRAEGGEVDVGDVEEAVGFDEDPAVSAGVPWQMNDCRSAVAQVEGVAARDPRHVLVGRGVCRIA